MHSVLWHRLDADGYDACCYTETPQGWTLAGAAVFAEAGCATTLSYRLICNGRWQSRAAWVSGWIGDVPLTLTLDRTEAGEWRVNGQVATALTGLHDIDLGFTPATNTNAIRRMNLAEGASADCIAVWLDTGDWSVKVLPQSYARTGARSYVYASPQHDYRATLLTDPFGVVVDYPGLWRIVRPG